jgi:hypothetical protein
MRDAAINGANGTPHHGVRALVLAPLVAALALLASCTTWRSVGEYDGWTLYASGDRAVDPVPFEEAFPPAIEAVEAAFGPFERSVRVYAWDEDAPHDDRAEELILEGDEGVVHDVPGIGPARVRAFHTRAEGPFGSPSGVFVGAAEPGTAAHELVHARLAEEDFELPLWLEEGLASLLGDGFLDGGRWVVDGLACWPLRELAEQSLPDAELANLLRMHARDRTSARENVLVHFVGWAIVFDLYREAGAIEWRAWIERYGRGIPLAEARTRIERSLAPETTAKWLERLADPRREVRLATAKGLWKLHSPAVVTRLVEALSREQDPEVKVCMAINALAAAGEIELSDRASSRLWRAAWPTLRRSKLADPAEQAAVEALTRTLRFRGNRSAQPQLQALKRFWAE